MSITGAAALGIGAVFFTLYLRSQQKEIAALISICASLILFTAALPQFETILSGIRELSADSGVGETAELLIKALGISAAAQITADICREAGESAVGTQVELFARAEIAVLSLPMAVRLLEMARGMLA